MRTCVSLKSIRVTEHIACTPASEMPPPNPMLCRDWEFPSRNGKMGFSRRPEIIHL